MVMKSILPVLFLFFLFGDASAQSKPISLIGSPESVDYQSDVINEKGLVYSQNGRELVDLIDRGILVEVAGGRYYDLYDVSFPFALPEVKGFVESLAQDYFGACNRLMIVTSLIRPVNRWLKNSHPKSVHPTGAAIDLRIPPNEDCEEWLEKRLIVLEEEGVIEATRENSPPHYHIAILSEDF
jgi:hypothetical protein